MFAVLLFGATAAAQDPDYVLRVIDSGAPSGANGTVPVELDNTGDAVQGLSFSVCSDASLLTPLGVQMGQDLAVLNDGDGADAFGAQITPDGVGVVSVMSFLTADVLNPGLELEIATIEYLSNVPAGVATPLTLCDTIGDPPVETILAVNGLAVSPVEISGTFTGDGAPANQFQFSVPDLTATFDGASGVGSFAAELQIADTGTTPQETFGFSMGLGHDSQFLSATFAEPAGQLEALNGGAGPEFFGVTIFPDGVTIGVAYALTSSASLTFGAPETVAEVQYSTNAGTVQGSGAFATNLVWLDTLGSPPIQNLVVISSAGDTSVPGLDNGTVTLIPDGEFVRGDCSADGEYTIGDPFALLNFLFLSGAEPTCLVACDANDNGGLGLDDAVYMLQNLFVSGPNPPQPFPVCGGDPTPDNLNCLDFPACP